MAALEKSHKFLHLWLFSCAPGRKFPPFILPRSKPGPVTPVQAVRTGLISSVRIPEWVIEECRSDCEKETRPLVGGEPDQPQS